MRSPRSAAGFRGTVRYAAVTAHKNKVRFSLASFILLMTRIEYRLIIL